MKFRKFLSSVLCLALIFTLLASLSLQAAASTAEDKQDYSKKGLELNKKISSADILEQILGEELAEVERAYLVDFGNAEILYYDGITTGYVTVDYDGESLEVFAREYTYRSTSGTSVTWIPSIAEIEGARSELALDSSGFYVTKFDTVTDKSELATLKIDYTLNFTVSKNTANSLLNQAYYDAEGMEEKFAEKEAEYEYLAREYAEAAARYEEYLDALAQYNEKNALYTEYLRRQRIYDEALADYNEYLSDLAEYAEAVVAYENYIAAAAQYEEDLSLYANYLNEYRIYAGELAEYNAFLEESAPCRSQLAIIELAKVNMSRLNRNIYSTINSGTVHQVVEQQDVLTSSLVGAPAKVIELAGDSVDRLIILLRDYFSLKTEAARYLYYTSYYEDFKTSIVNLFISLDYLYTNSTVRGILYDEGKEEKYMILLCQLYLFATAISDEPVRSVDPKLVEGSKDAKKYVQFTYDDSYTVDELYEYTITDILGSTEYIIDTDSATPLATGFPNEVPEPIAPDAVPEPKKPAYVPKPVEVTEVSHPGDPPKAVERPTAPTTLADPGEAPEPYAPSEEELALLSSYKNGELLLRSTAVTDDIVYTVHKTVTKRYTVDDEVTVWFLDSDKVTELYSVTVDKGTSADYNAELPEREETERAYYTFVGWQDADGAAVSLESIRESVVLYPIFEETVKNYNITWTVEGESITESLPYGTVPAYPKTPSKPDAGIYMYTFVGWDTEPAAVTRDAHYTAVFREEYILPTSGGAADFCFDGENLVCDLRNTFDAEFTIMGVVARASGVGGLLLETNYSDIYFSFATVEGLASAGACTLKLTITKHSGYSSYAVDILDKNGERLEQEIRLTLTPRMTVESIERLRLYHEDESGERTYAKFTLGDGGIPVFSLTAGNEYILSDEYSLTIASSQLAGISAEKKLYYSGEAVNVKLSFPLGMRLSRLYYITSSGDTVELSSLSFEMPSDDITLVAEAEYIKYKITFLCDGKVITTLYVKSGELPEAPENPIKLSDSEYTYRFSGWSSEVIPAEGNKIYTAVFEKLPNAPKLDTVGGVKLDFDVILIVFALVLLGFLGLIFIAVRKNHCK